MLSSNVPGQATTTFQVGPDVQVDIGPEGKLARWSVRVGGRPRRSEVVRIPGSGDPFIRETINGQPFLEVFLDTELKVSTLRVT